MLWATLQPQRFRSTALPAGGAGDCDRPSAGASVRGRLGTRADQGRASRQTALQPLRRRLMTWRRPLEMGPSLILHTPFQTDRGHRKQKKKERGASKQADEFLE